MDQNSGLYWQQPTIVNNQISFPKEESLKAKGPNISYIPYYNDTFLIKNF